MASKDVNRKKLEADLKEMEAKMVRLEAEAAEAGEQSRTQAERMFEELRARQHEAERRLDELRRAGTAASRDLVEGFEDAYRSFERSMEKALARFR